MLPPMQLVLNPSSADSAVVHTADHSRWRAVITFVIALVAFLGCAIVLIAVIAPTSSAAGGCGGG
jgi:hypothetical protein